MIAKAEINELVEIFDAYNDDFPFGEIRDHIKTRHGSLFHSIADNLLRVRKARGGSPHEVMWSTSMTREDLLVIYDPKLGSEKKSSNFKNYCKYLVQLKEWNMIYECGTRQSKIFMIERNSLSWGPLSANPLIYPASMLAMLKSRQQMCTAILEGLCESRVPIESVMKSIANFFSDLTTRMDPSIMAHQWDGVISAESYCRQLERTMEIKSPYSGFDADSLDAKFLPNTLMKRLSSPINSSRFNELVPENVNAVSMKKKKRHVNPAYGRKMDILDNVPTEALDIISGGALPLLQCFQRFVLPEIVAIPGPTYRCFLNYGQEEMYAENIKNTLLAAGKFNREVILSWVNWFAISKAKNVRVLGTTCALKLLFMTWNEFSVMSESAAWTNIVSQDDFPSSGPLFSRMVEFSKKSPRERLLEEFSSRFGFVISYWFMAATGDAELAVTTLVTYFNNVKDHIKTNDQLRAIFMKAMRKTLIYEVKPRYLPNWLRSQWSFFTSHPQYESKEWSDIKKEDVISYEHPEIKLFWSVIDGKMELKVDNEKYSST